MNDAYKWEEAHPILFVGTQTDFRRDPGKLFSRAREKVFSIHTETETVLLILF